MRSWKLDVGSRKKLGSFQLFDETVEHSGDFFERIVRIIKLSDVAKFKAQFDQTLALASGSKRNSEVSGEVGVCSASMTLCDVRADRNRSTAQLIGKSESFGIGKGFGFTIDCFRCNHRLLPNFKIPKTPSHRPILLTSDFQLPTSN